MTCSYCHTEGSEGDKYSPGKLVADINGNPVPGDTHFLCEPCRKEKKVKLFCLAPGCPDEANDEGYCFWHWQEYKVPLCELCQKRQFITDCCLHVKCPYGTNKENIEHLIKMNRMKACDYKIVGKYSVKFTELLQAVSSKYFHGNCRYQPIYEEDKLTYILYTLETLLEDLKDFETMMKQAGIKFTKGKRYTIKSNTVSGKVDANGKVDYNTIHDIPRFPKPIYD